LTGQVMATSIKESGTSNLRKIQYVHHKMSDEALKTQCNWPRSTYMALLDALLSLKSTASCKGLAMLAIVDVSMHPRASGQLIMLI
jgi:hypothetical protein